MKAARGTSVLGHKFNTVVLFIFVVFDESLKFFSTSPIVYNFSGSFVLNPGKKNI